MEEKRRKGLLFFGFVALQNKIIIYQLRVLTLLQFLFNPKLTFPELFYTSGKNPRNIYLCCHYHPHKAIPHLCHVWFGPAAAAEIVSVSAPSGQIIWAHTFPPSNMWTALNFIRVPPVWDGRLWLKLGLSCSVFQHPIIGLQCFFSFFLGGTLLKAPPKWLGLFESMLVCCKKWRVLLYCIMKDLNL